MSIAIFKPFILAAQEGERVWEKLVQKVIEKDEVDAHVADGWHTDAATALEAANAAEVEQGNAALQAQIDDAKAKLDGRTKAGKAAKQAVQPEQPEQAAEQPSAPEAPAEQPATPPAEPSA